MASTIARPPGRPSLSGVSVGLRAAVYVRVSSEEQVEEKRARLEDVLQMTEEAGSFFQDETKLETNPKVGYCWMRKGKQKRLRTPGTNRARCGSAGRSTSKRGVCTG